MFNTPTEIFDADVLDAVYDALENSEVAESAEMYNSTLFVTCNAYAAAKIESSLIKNLGCGVIVSKVGDMFAFDFV